MGTIFDQDDFNMPMVQSGMQMWPDELEGVTLGRYQENRIRFLHRMIETWLGRPPG